VAGQEAPDKGEADQLDYAALAKFPGTLVFYMGITTSGDWSARLIQHGKSAATPVAVVRRCSFPDQQSIFTTLGQLPAALARGGEKLRPPAIVIVGEVARESTSTNWFAARPLFGRTVLVTRPAGEGGSAPSAGDELAARLRDLGANVIHQPAIIVREPADWSPADAAIDRLDDFDWLVFTSANGVNFFLLRLFLLGHDTRALGKLKLAVVGAATEEELLQYFLTADVCPGVARAEALADELAPHASGNRFLLARGSRGREVLAERLIAAGGYVEQVVVYESADVPQVDESIVAAMSAGKFHWTTVTSSAIARNLVHLFGTSLRNTRLVAISPLTAGTLTELGYEPTAIAGHYTTDGLIDAILAAEGQT
jgi:uroporphyrinogen III methyltransferase/synthase